MFTLLIQFFLVYDYRLWSRHDTVMYVLLYFSVQSRKLLGKEGFDQCIFRDISFYKTNLSKYLSYKVSVSSIFLVLGPFQDVHS